MNCKNDDSLYNVFSQVIRLHYHRAHTMLEKAEVYPGQPPMLIALYHQDGQSQKELAKKLNIKPATITVMLKRMENSKLLERRPDTQDQRVTRVYLTDKGRETFIKVREILDGITAECFSNFTSEEEVILRRLLMQVRDNLQRSSGKA